MDGATKISEDASADSGLRVLGFLLGDCPSSGHQFGDPSTQPVPGQLGDHVAKAREGICTGKCTVVFELPKLTSLVRARAKIQNQLGLFQASASVKKRRHTLEEEERESALAAPTSLPLSVAACRKRFSPPRRHTCAQGS
jgi:hypothetical protein